MFSIADLLNGASPAEDVLDHYTDEVAEMRSDASEDEECLLVSDLELTIEQMS